MHTFPVLLSNFYTVHGRAIYFKKTASMLLAYTNDLVQESHQSLDGDFVSFLPGLQLVLYVLDMDIGCGKGSKAIVVCDDEVGNLPDPKLRVEVLHVYVPSVLA